MTKRKYFITSKIIEVKIIATWLRCFGKMRILEYGVLSLRRAKPREKAAERMKPIPISSFFEFHFNNLDLTEICINSKISDLNCSY